MSAFPSRLCRVALLFVCTGAHAAWDEIERYDDGTRILVDRQRASRDEGIVRLPHLVRWGEPQADPGQPPYQSTLVRTAYDCVNKRQRYLASTSYSGSQGDGTAVLADEDEAEDWDTVSDGSMEEKLWHTACDNKIP